MFGRKIGKRSVAAILFLAIMFQNFPVFAYEGNNEVKETIEKNTTENGTNLLSEEDIATEGQCGENLRWKFEKGVLTISGTGWMDISAPEWWTLGIEKIVIEEGLTYIKYEAFRGLKELVSVSIPNTVTQISQKAFADCTTLKSVQIPGSVDTMGIGIFSGCGKLETVKFCDGATIIGDYMFQSCTNLKTIEIPNSMTSIGEYAFEYCTSLTNIYIPYGVTVIGAGAFQNCTSLENVHIPVSVTIWQGFFAGCSSLKSINIPNGVTCLEGYNFKDCTSLSSIEIPATVERISYRNFMGCSSLQKISVQSDSKYYCSVEDVLYTLDKTELVAYPSSKSGSSYTVLESVTSIAGGAFSGCTGLESINLHEDIEYIEGYAFSGCSNLKNTVLPEKLTHITSFMFEGCKSLENIIIPSNIVKIEYGAFMDCDSLKKITIPENVRNMESCVFYGCDSLTEVHVKGKIGNSSYALQSVFDDVSTLSVYLPAKYWEHYQYVRSTCENINWIKVTEPQEEKELTLNYATLNINYGKTATLIAKLKQGEAVLDVDATWKSSDTSVATVDKGKIIPKGEGNCTITAIVDGMSASCEVTVSVADYMKYNINDTYSIEHVARQVSYSTLCRLFNPLKAQMLWKKEIGDTGVCHGMAVSAAASVVYGSPKVQSYGYNTLSELQDVSYSTQSAMQLKEFVEYVHATQYTTSSVNDKKNAKSDLAGLYNAVVNNIINNGDPVILAIRGRKENVGHAVWVLGIGENTNKKTELIVYDCNWEKETRSLWLKKENGQFVSWEYEIFEGEIWGTGKVNASLKYYNPAKNFVERYGENVGFKPREETIMGESQALIKVSNENTSVVTKEGEKILLSPDTEHQRILYVETSDVIRDMQQNDKKMHYFWADLNDEFKLSTDDETTIFNVASEEVGVELELPDNAEARVALSGKVDSIVELDVSKGQEFSVGFNEVEGADVVESITISGESEETEIKVKQTNQGIIVETASLEDLQVMKEYVDAKGNQKIVDTITVSTEKDSVLIKEDGDVLVGMEDSDGDRVYETVVSIPNAPETAKVKKYNENGDVILSWTASGGANGYDVYYKKITEENYTYYTNTSNTECVIPKLLDNVIYRFKVVPYYYDGVQKYCGENVYVTVDYMVQTGQWVQDHVGWWYLNGDGSYPYNCWKQINDVWYYFNASGYIVTGWQAIGGTWYYFETSGAMVIDWKALGDTWYYFDENGAMVTGWREIKDTWYYFKASGAMVTGWQAVGSTWYYFETSGAMATGWKAVGGVWYYFNAGGAMVTGWQKIDDKWYYFENSGVMVAKRWVGNYYLQPDGVMATNMWIGRYYVDENGLWVP